MIKRLMARSRFEEAQYGGFATLAGDAGGHCVLHAGLHNLSSLGTDKSEGEVS
jgi:hypothetical protein